MPDAIELSPLVIRAVENTFAPDEQAAVLEILRAEGCSRLPLAQAESYERIHLAILKIAAGKLSQLDEAVRLAETDWRDLLMWAEFGSDLEAHLRWARRICSRCEG